MDAVDFMSHYLRVQPLKLKYATSTVEALKTNVENKTAKKSLGI